MRRDFTYVDDIVEGVVRVLDRPPAADADGAPYAIYNIGNHESVALETFIATLERLLGRPAIREYAPMQPGDVPATFAAIDRLAARDGIRAADAARRRTRALRRVVPRVLRHSAAVSGARMIKFGTASNRAARRRRLASLLP